MFSKADDAADEDDAKSAITDRSVSFIGETLKEMNIMWFKLAPKYG